MNVLLNFISEFRIYTENTYTIDGNAKKAVKGRQTNEAVTKMLLKDKDFCPNKIISICTESVCQHPAAALKESEGEHARTTWEYYQDTVKEAGFEGDFVSIQVHNSMTDKERIDTIREINDKLKPKDRLLLDMTGGMRDTAMLLISVARYLQVLDIDTVGVYYSDLTDRSQAKGVIRQGADLYRMFDYIAAVEEFVSNGRADKIYNCVKNRDWDQNSEKRKLLESIMQFSDDLALCKVGNLNSDVKNLMKQLREYKTSPEKAGDMDDLLIRLLVNRFEEYFAPIRDAKNNNLPYLVKWCNKRQLYQQALTLLCEQFPDYFCKHVFLQPENQARVFISTQGQNEGKNWTYPLFHFHFTRLNLFGKFTTDLRIDKTKNTDKVEIFRLASRHENEDFLNRAVKGKLLAFRDEQKDLILDAMAAYQKIYFFRNMIHHAGDMSAADRIEEQEVTVANVKKYIDEAADLLSEVSSMKPEPPDGVALLPIRELKSEDIAPVNSPALDSQQETLQQYLDRLTRIISEAGSLSFRELNERLQADYKPDNPPSSKSFGFSKLSELLKKYDGLFLVQCNTVSLR